MSGWEMTKGSFSHSVYNAKIHNNIFFSISSVF